MDWQERAACAGLRTDLFYPAPSDHAGLARARAVCGACPVATSCLLDALLRDEEFGVWGGASANQRHRMLRRARQVA